MAQHTQIQEDPKELARAQEIWRSFMNISKWSIIAIIIVLLGLAAAFVTF